VPHVDRFEIVFLRKIEEICPDCSVAFADSIRRNERLDFLPEPYRKSGQFSDPPAPVGEQTKHFRADLPAFTPKIKFPPSPRTSFRAVAIGRRDCLISRTAEANTSAYGEIVRGRGVGDNISALHPASKQIRQRPLFGLPGMDGALRFSISVGLVIRPAWRGSDKKNPLDACQCGVGRFLGGRFPFVAAPGIKFC